MSKFTLILCAAILLFCQSCEKPEFEAFSGTGMRPIYVSTAELLDITNIEPQPIEETGPIFLVGDWFFMVEVKKGIHVFDINDTAQETALTFLKIPAITDFTIEDNILYCDSWTDLLSIDISNIFEIQLLNRSEDIFDAILIPPNFFGIFECVDLEQGAVIDWESTNLQRVFCETTF